MRKFVTAALESSDSYYSNGQDISMEEEMVMLDEAAVDQADATQDLAEAERIIEVSDALEDLAVIADGIEEASPTETALIEAAGTMAVAGTDVAPEEIVPAMESYVGRRIATEGIRETARQIWDSIQKFLKNIWEKITNFFYKTFGTIPGLRKRIDAQLKRIDDASGKKAEESKITLATGITSITTDNVVAKNEANLAAGMKLLTEAGKYAFGAHQEAIAKQGETIAKAISDFDPAKAEESAVALRDGMRKDNVKLPGAGAVNATRFPGFKTKFGAALPGNVSLVYKGYDDNTGASTLASLDRMRKSGVELISTNEKTKDAPNDVVIATLSLSGATGLLESAKELLETLEDFNRGKRSKEIKKTQKSIEDASAKATKEMEKAKSDTEDAVAKGSVPYYRALLNFNAAYARWAQQPAMPLLSHSLSTIRTIMVIVDKSLAQYK